MTDNARQSSSILIAAAWAIVVIPTAWGLNYTVQNALKIFAKSPASTVAPTTPVR